MEGHEGKVDDEVEDPPAPIDQGDGAGDPPPTDGGEQKPEGE